MGKYRKRPVVVEAVQFTDKTKDRVFQCLTGQVAADFEDGVPILKVTTIHGEIAIVRFGDWIISEDVPGYYYPCKPDIFQKTYEEVLSDDSQATRNQRLPCAFAG